MTTAVGAIVGIIGTLVIAMQTIILNDIKELRNELAQQVTRINVLAEKVAKLGG